MSGRWLQDLSLWDFIKLMVLVPLSALRDAIKNRKKDKDS